MQSYKVITTAENTGLDLAVFPSCEEAEMAAELAKEMFAGTFEVIETKESPNTTYGKWVAAGW
jgi:hypothetical protein